MLASLFLAAVQAPNAPTFTRDIAPILQEHCAPCHRPGESAPFPLLSYGDARKRASQIAEVTASGFMPPWLPEPTAYRFRDDRSLSPDQVATLAAWAESGTPPGAPEDLAPARTWPLGWQLGEPDLVLRVDAGFELAAAGSDEFRNLVLSNTLGETRFVRAVEVRPGNPSVHHAILQVDETPSCRVLDEVDDAPGFAGMTMGESHPPDGHFIGWTPGKLPRLAAPDMAWRLRPGADLVLQLHLTKTGKRETIRPEVGLYFTDRAPTRFPYSIVLYREDIEIPAGEAAHTIRDEYVVPTDIEVLTVYPHAHYLGRRVRATVVRPDGSREQFLRIDDWDFNWQDEYHFAEPVELPTGSVVTMEWVYDNTPENVRNPHHPPRTVKFGPSSVDEMGTLTLGVLPRDPGVLVELDRARWRGVLKKNPYDWYALNRLAALAIDAGDLEGAGVHLEQALFLNPDFPDALTNAGLLVIRRGRPEEALGYLRGALGLEPAHPGANAKLGMVLRLLGRAEEATAHFEHVLERWPYLAESQVEFGSLLALTGRPRLAIEHFQAAVRLTPGLPEAHNNLANTHFVLEEFDLAVAAYERAIALRPAYFNARFNLGRCYVAVGLLDRALPHLLEATRLRPDDEPAAAALRDLLVRTGKDD